MKTLFPIQRTLVDHLRGVLETKGAALNASDTGTGKTLMSVELARDLGCLPLVVCPKAVVPAWRSAFEEQGVPYVGVVNYESLRTGNTVFATLSGTKPAKGKPDRRKFSFSTEIPFIIWDECHRAKEGTSLNAKLVRAAVDAPHGIFNLFLSATASSNPAEMKVLGYALGLHEWTDFYQWARLRGCSKDPWGNLKFTESEKRANQILVELREELYPSCGGKVSREDMAEFFSETRIIDEPLDFGDDGEIQRLYREMDAQIAALEEKEANDSVNPAAEALIAMLRARQRVELLKIPLMAEMAKDAIAEGLHVAAFLNFNDSIRALADKLGSSVPIVWGTDPERGVQQTDQERAAAIEAFQTNREPVILLNIEAGGVAISLHDQIGNAPRLALISPTWNEKSLQQVLGRVDRAGAKTDTLQRILFAAGTVEETVREALARKLTNLKTLHHEQPPLIMSSAAPAESAPASPSLEGVIDIEVEVIDSVGEVTVTEPAHAEFGPSSLRYFEICPSYLNREEQEDDVNEAAASGTRIHEALENDDPESLADEEEQNIAWMLLHAARQAEEAHQVADGEHHREIRLAIDLAQHKTFGTLDRLAIKGRVAVAQDYKCGWTPVDDAEVNAQAWAYSLGVFQKFPEVEIVHFYFLLVRQDTMTYAVFTRDENTEPEDWWEDEGVKPSATMADMHLRANLIIERVRQLSGKEFNPQPHNCEWCGNKVHCKALERKALVIAKHYEEDGLPLPGVIDPEKIETSVDIGRARMLVQVLETWIEQVKARANWLYQEKGVEIPGFKWTTRKTKRVVSDAVAAYNVAHDTVGIELSDFIACVGAVRIGELEKLVKDKAPRGEKEDKLQEFLSVLTENEILSGGDGEIGYLTIDRSKK